ncbi:MAG: PaaI family thioesterase [Thermodesulfobacteriota bacterium]
MDDSQTERQGPGLVKTPTVNTFNIRYLRSGPGWVAAEFAPDGRFVNNFGLVQGGVLGVFLDNIMGQSCYTLLEPGLGLTTTTLNLQFLEPAPPGVLKGSARVVKSGRRVFFAEGQVQDAQGRPLARATATMLVLSNPRPAPAGPAA